MNYKLIMSAVSNKGLMKNNLPKGFIIALIYIIAVSVVLQSCRKNEILESSNSTQDALLSESTTYTVSNGVMVFASQESMNQYLNSLIPLTEVELNEVNKESNTFTSLYRQYQKMDTEADANNGISADSAINSKLIAWIPDDIFASIVNHQGFLAVGDSLYKYESNGFKVAPIEALELLDSYPFASLDNNDYAPLFSWGNVGNQNWASFPPKSHFFEQDENSQNWPTSNGRKTRMVHTKWCSWFGIYSSIGSKVKMEKKTRYAGWINIQHDYAQLMPLASDYRYAMFTYPGLGWHYENGASDYNQTWNQNVCQKAMMGSVGVLPPVAGPCQYKVGTYQSHAFIVYKGKQRFDDWWD